eukprot:COSAG02_NODE_6605_length_3464_cov_3.857355_4_plen_319_part_00
MCVRRRELSGLVLLKMQTHSAATFDRQTRAVEERQDHEPEEPEPEPETYSEHLQSQEKEEEDEDEDEEEGDSRGFGVRCCISTRAGLGVAAVVQLGLSAGSVLTVAPTWPSRPGLLAWQCVVLFAVWLSAAMENRSVATASFVALSAGSAALLALWSTAQPPRLLCEHASQHGCTEGTRDGCCYRCTGFHSAISPSEWEAGCSDRMVVEGKFCWYPVSAPCLCLLHFLRHWPAFLPQDHARIHVCARACVFAGVNTDGYECRSGVIVAQSARPRCSVARLRSTPASRPVCVGVSGHCLPRALRKRMWKHAVDRLQANR